jgi:capsular exopolysaccharide synthesis family protein
MENATHQSARSPRLAVLRRHVPVIVICALLAPAAALGLSLVQQKKYAATASLLFRDPGLDQKLFGSTFQQPTQDPTRAAATNVRLVSLSIVADRTARALGRPWTRDRVSHKIDVAGDQSDVVSVKATDHSPGVAARLANTFGRQYIAFRRDADRSKFREAQALVAQQLQTLTPAQQQGSEGRALRARAEQLQTLAALQTGNAELVQPADVPDSPTSPRPMRNVLIGALLGLALGIATAFLLERLDRRLRNASEVEEIFERPVLGVIPTSRAIAAAGPARESELPLRDEEAFRILRANLRYFNVDRPVHSVLVTSAEPGDGKSTVSWNLALAAANAGGRALFLEADLRRPRVAESNQQVRPAPGLTSVLSGHAKLGEAVQTVALGGARADAGEMRTMDVIVAGPVPPNPVDLIESDRMREIVRQVEEQYDLVVIDSPPMSVVSDAIPLVKQANGVIVVARLGKSRRESVSHLHVQLQNLNAAVLGVVVNSRKAERLRGYGLTYQEAYAPQSANGPVMEPGSLAGMAAGVESASEPPRDA